MELLTEPPAPAAAPEPIAAPGARRRAPAVWIALAAITLLAGALRLVSLRSVPNDPFYDAAVRSMTLSLHNFFFGAYEPGASVSIDKPPLDLWLQVISVKAFGFGAVALKLPEALGGTVAVPLLFWALRRCFGDASALMGALVLAVLPTAVMTSRSDTMDAVMMALTVIALGLVVHAGLTGRVRWLYAAAVALGLAFNVKLLEALIPLPALLALAALALPGTRRFRTLHIAGAGALYVVIALSWLTATLAFPAHDRPFAIGSTNGSAWDAAFVFNGYDRIAKPARQSDTSIAAGHQVHHRQATSDREVALDHQAIAPPAALRLLDRIGPLSGRRLGFVLLSALLLGIPALVSRARRRAAPSTDAEDGDPVGAEHRRRLQRAGALAILVWLVEGTLLFTVMARLHPRYVEAFTPAVAAAAGVGLVWAVGESRRARLTLVAVLAVLAPYAFYLHSGPTLDAWITVLAAVIAGAAAILVTRRLWGRSGPALALGAGAVACLALPVAVSLGVIRDSDSDAGHPGYMRPGDLAHLSAYLRSHRAGARYEVAATSATQAGSLIVSDAQPVLILTTYDGQATVSVDELSRLVAQGQVRYALVVGSCRIPRPRLPQCSAPGRWVLAHGTNVSAEAGLAHSSLLWRLSSR